VIGTVLSASVLLADDKVRGPEFGQATPTALAVILILLAVTFLLIRSMNRHVKNLPESFDQPDAGDGESDGDRPLGEGPDGTGPDGAGRDGDGRDSDGRG
jgi:hypothetical protein